MHVRGRFCYTREMRIVTFDIETTGAFAGSDYTNIELTIVGVHDSLTDTYEAYLKEDLPKLWKLLEETDILVGYNSDHFDIPVLNKYYPGDLTKIRSIDLLKEVADALGRRLRLDAIAEGTLNKKKSGSGRDAMVWWKEGNIKKLREYCLKDVEITKKVFDHARETGSLFYKELGKKKEIKLNTSKWLETRPHAALTQTLGF